tara:strand:- start:838 stop:1965 length:1128 start_codon:yes stop_codon:yes gene_type:complete
MGNLQSLIERASFFVDGMEDPTGFRLFARSGVSPYARCFAIFSKALCQDHEWLDTRRDKLINDLNEELSIFYDVRTSLHLNLKMDKPFLQLFCFSLSALNILRGELSEKNRFVLEKYLNDDLLAGLIERDVHGGSPGSGNHAMFVAILIIAAQELLGLNKSKEIAAWLNFNANHINSHGFWGNYEKFSHLQFQNGYHQYEIFEFLGYDKAPWVQASLNTLSLADREGHFSPYPGGGGCYDYDAVFMLTSHYTGDIGQTHILAKTLKSLVCEQNLDGGFCESKLLRRNGIPRLASHIQHITGQPRHLRFSSMITGLNLLRYKHRVVRTHWTEIDRRWDESNLWDTFFRLSAISRICQFLDLPERKFFDNNNFPGIG